MCLLIIFYRTEVTKCVFSYFCIEIEVTKCVFCIYSIEIEVAQSRLLLYRDRIYNMCLLLYRIEIKLQSVSVAIIV